MLLSLEMSCLNEGGSSGAPKNHLRWIRTNSANARLAVLNNQAEKNGETF